MKKYFVLFLISAQLFSQEKSKIIFRNEILTIKTANELEVTNQVNEKRFISKSKNTQEYSVRIPFDSFSEVSNIKGSTYLINKDKTINLYSSSVSTHDVIDENIYKSDNKYKYFVLPQVDDNSEIEFSYKIKQLEPRFLSLFQFQNPLKTQASRFQIKCQPTTEIGFSLFGVNQDKITFTKTKENNLDVYTWETKDMPEFEPEYAMPGSLYFIPHLVYYIKSYEIEGKKEELLGTPEQLYKWYFSLIKDINQKSQLELESKTAELIKDKKTDFEKAKAIFYWVQQNLHYVAFEDGMGGFIPREAADVFQKKYGDCKDMANLLNQMLKYAKLNSNLTWIGTRLKPYRYQEVPTPMVDNHMITQVVLDGKSYFLDATDKFCPFPHPSAMIQGKEALIAKTQTDFKIEKVEEIAPTDNKIAIVMDLNLQNNSISGNVKTEVYGINKSFLLNNLSVYNQKENEIRKSLVTTKNNKIQLEISETQKNDYQDMPSTAQFKLELGDAVKSINDKFIVKPILLFPLKENSIDIDQRKLSIENDIAYAYDIQYNYQIPTDLKIDFIPENATFENELASFSIQYKQSKNSLSVSQKIVSKKLLIEKKDFIEWNSFIKLLNKQYNQSIILSK